MAVTLQARVEALAIAIAAEARSLRTLLNVKSADNSAITTVAKSNLVAAINEVFALATQANNKAGAQINDASTTSTTETYSVSKILAALAAEIVKIDSDREGKVNSAAVADAVPWTGVSSKPSTFPPAAHDAALVTSGVFDVARIPVLPSQRQIVSSGALTALTVPQQGDIGQGTIVTTTDGFRYVYSGSGDKTLAASYVVLADTTPDWSTVSSKPTTLTGYGITDAQAKDATLTALAGLTTAANQMIYSTGADTFGMATLSAFARTILDDANGAAVRTTIDAYGSVEIGNPDTDFVATFNAALV